MKAAACDRVESSLHGPLETDVEPPLGVVDTVERKRTSEAYESSRWMATRPALPRRRSFRGPEPREVVRALGSAGSAQGGARRPPAPHVASGYAHESPRRRPPHSPVRLNGRKATCSTSAGQALGVVSEPGDRHHTRDDDQHAPDSCCARPRGVKAIGRSRVAPPAGGLRGLPAGAARESLTLSACANAPGHH